MHAMAFDSARNRVVLFGGDGGQGNGLADTWEWNGTTWSQIADFGPDPCLAAAMVFKGDRAALFGGIDSVNAAPAPRVLQNTWEWDGRHWTQRQDIGPGPRWRHAMAFDRARSRIVLFGGVRIFAAPNDPALADNVLGDTWEHSETGAGQPPAPPGVDIIDLSLSTDTVAIDQAVDATVTLSGPAPAAGVTVAFGFIPEAEINDPNAQPTLLQPIVIAAGETAGTLQFTMSTPGAFAILAGLGNTILSETLTVT
jgi:hypothetical protein